MRRQLQFEAIVAALYGLDRQQFRWIIKDCDYPSSVVTEEAYARFDPKGFWRVDKAVPPEQRFTILSLIAFLDLQRTIDDHCGNFTAGIESFCNQNDGEGWMLPEMLRLADYGLGHDDRAKEHQPVRECFGPRFYDWQLAQTAEESWRECHLHARNLLGPEGYQALIDELEGRAPPPPKAAGNRSKKERQQTLFETEHLPLFPDKHE